MDKRDYDKTSKEGEKMKCLNCEYWTIPTSKLQTCGECRVISDNLFEDKVRNYDIEGDGVKTAPDFGCVLFRHKKLNGD